MNIIKKIIGRRRYKSYLLIIALLGLILFVSFAEAPTSTPTTEGGEEETTNDQEPAADERTVMIGAWLGGWPSRTERNIEYFNQLANYQADIIHTYVYVTQDMDDWKGFMDYVHEQKAINLLTIMMRKSDKTDYTTVDVNNGKLDAYYTSLAKQMRDWQGGAEIWIQPMYEANGYWFGWCLGNSSINTNESFQSAFQRIVNIFRDNGANNVKFIYNVNYGNNGKGASFMGPYPGDEYVDYLSIDGYNWGTSQSWSSWWTFRQTFDTAYYALVSGSNKPVIISEVASAEEGGDKAAWITDMKTQIESGAYPELIAIVWFNDYDRYYGIDWRINSSESSLAAFSNFKRENL